MYKITVECIEISVSPEKNYHWVNKDTGVKCEYSSENAIKKYYETGKMLTEETIQEVFTQRIAELDVAKLAVFLNSK